MSPTPGRAAPVRKRCGTPDQSIRVRRLSEPIREDMWVREAMGTALMGIGKRNKTLNKAAIRAAKAIGPLDIDYGPDNSCEPIDLLKHLTSDYLKKKLGT